MSFAELQPRATEAPERTGEIVANEIRDNLWHYILGERPDFGASFPLGIDPVQDAAHEIFLQSIGVKEIAEDHVVISAGRKLFRQFLARPKEPPFHVTYSSEPIPNCPVS